MGNILQHGIGVYKQTMNPVKEPPVFLKETKPRKSSFDTQVQTVKTTDSKTRRVAKFLILIGSEQASEILAELDSEQVEQISKEITSIKAIKPEERDEILNEFHLLFSKLYTYSGSSCGGIETARRILYKAKGPEKGEELLNKAIPETKENLFSFLEEFSKEQLVMLLKEENAQTTALILSRMPTKLSAGVLSKLPQNRKAGVLLRMAKQKEVSPEILEQVSAALKEKVRHIAGGSKDIEIDGMQRLAEILKHGDYAFGDRLINEIEDDDPQIGHNLKEKLYTLDDVLLAIDRPIQEKLKTMPEYDIALLLKGKKEEFCEKILSNVSAGRRKLIREEIEIIGAVPKRDCDAVARDFLAWFRFARENGDILLITDEEVVV